MRKGLTNIGILAALVLVLTSMAMAVYIYPDGAGAYSNWTNVSCSASNEWQCVDEPGYPPNTADNLYATATNLRETFTFGDLSLHPDTQITSVWLYYYGIRYSSSRYLFTPTIRISGALYNGTNQTLTSAYSLFSQGFNTNPATGSAWTVAEVNALEAGMRSYGPYGGGRIAQVYASVNYIPYGYNCTDTDGSVYPGEIYTSGTVSGYYNLTYYSNDDYCVNETILKEYYCSGNYKYSYNVNCAGNVTGSCVAGACV